MTTLLIGHRGTGKTTLLNRLQLGGVSTFDLDREIEARSGTRIDKLFTHGEARFRDLERQTLNQILASVRGPTVIAIGAGFEGPLPLGTHVVWLRRLSDKRGRVFLNRPRLNPDLSPWEEFRARFEERDSRYRSWTHEELTLPEGYDGGLEDFFVNEARWNLPFDLTVRPQDFRDWGSFWEKRRHWNLRRLELRDDWLTPAQIHQVIEAAGADRVLFSRRKERGTLIGNIPTDWALELGPPSGRFQVLSVHERRSDLRSTFELLDSFSMQGEILKAAVEIRNFEELKMGHDWWKKDPAHRAFLPRSADGRWRWFRSLFGRSMPIHFFREGEGSGLDQPVLWEMLLQPRLQDGFAAVIGQPIENSLSPWEQRKFFSTRGFPFVAIDTSQQEFFTTVPILREWGLKAAAVTSPLKMLAYEMATQFTAQADELKSANTLYLDDKAIWAHNTDVVALETLARELGPRKTVWLWGGGGVVSSVQKVWPNQKRISARDGTSEAGNPDLLIWAANRSREFQFPPASVRPALVLDLNYGDDSPGLEWAAVQNHPYQSGIKMFKLQAEAQREFWRERMKA